MHGLLQFSFLDDGLLDSISICGVFVTLCILILLLFNLALEYLQLEVFFNFVDLAIVHLLLLLWRWRDWAKRCRLLQLLLFVIVCFDDFPLSNLDI